MIVFWVSFLQLLLTSVCLGQSAQDSPVLHVVPPARAPQVLCYLNYEARERKGEGAFTAEDIDPKLCTHVIYAYGTLEGNHLLADNKEEADHYEATVALRNKNPNLKILISIGGYETGASPFKAITASVSGMKTFANEAIEFLRRYKFNGLDVAWHYPIGAEDRAALVNLLKILRQSFEEETKISGQPRLLLTALVDASFEWATGGYDVPEISKYVDFINTILYYFHGYWGSAVGQNAPLFARKSAAASEKKLTVDYTAKAWVKMGAPKEKLMIGMATFGETFTLVDPTKFDIGARFSAGGSQGQYTAEQGILSYYEICEFLKMKNTTYVWDDEEKVPFAHRADQWVGYDNARSVKTKMAWLKKEGFGGVAVWSIDLDDFRGICGTGKFPLLKAMRQELAGYKVKLQYRGPYESSYFINKDRRAADQASVLEAISSLANKQNHACSSDQFHCNNGQCIDQINRCDGKAHCSDGSDETFTLCKNFRCSNEHFRCKYGGCVQKAKKCNRVLDCADASDEDATICANMTAPDGCVAPPSITGTQYISGLCDPSDASSICVAKTGSIMAFGSHLNVRCSEGYSLLPGASSQIVCKTSEEYSPFPPTTCLRTCPPLVNYPNVEAECKLTDYVKEGRPYYRILPCDLPMVEGTKVTLSCPLHFKQQKKVLTCLENGQWDLVPTMECEPLCGIRRESLIRRIEGASIANQTDYPWHAGLYWLDETDGKFEHKYVCGGSLISQSTVLTAAHCGFADGSQKPSEQMYVALGKQKLQWDAEEGNTTQRFSVKEFIVLPEYTGPDQSFSFDVALVVLADPVKFDDHVHPVCVNNLPSRFQSDNAVGLLPGWGGTALAATSEELHTAQIPYVPRNQCHALLKSDLNTRILTHDKFCGGFLGPTGAKASQGDSGGGLVYEDNGLYYVVGVVSTTLLRDNFRIGTYTNVSTHYDWIRRKMI